MDESIPTGRLRGAGGSMVKVRQAYVDWAIPDTTVRTRMGIQNFAMPYAAGGPAVFDLRGAAVNTHLDFNDNIGLTAFWFRPFNDNYDSSASVYEDNGDPSGYLDNMDLFSLILPMNFESISLTPWVMYGIQGRNTGNFASYKYSGLADGAPAITLTPYLNALGKAAASMSAATAAPPRLTAACSGPVFRSRSEASTPGTSNLISITAMSKKWASSTFSHAMTPTTSVAAPRNVRAGWSRLLSGTIWTGALRASSAGTSRAMTAI